MRNLIPIFLFLQACATPRIYTAAIPSTDYVEAEPLPPDPGSITIPDEISPQDWVISLEKNKPAPESGILVSEARAYKDAQYRIRYKELRDLFTRSRVVWSLHREYYEGRVRLLQESLDDLKPSILDEYLPEALFLGGFLGGAVLQSEVTKCP